jgi:hypothetical protein
MTPHTHSTQRSLASSLLAELLKVVSHVGALQTELRFTQEVQDKRLTALEQRMDSPPQHRPLHQSRTPTSTDATPAWRRRLFERAKLAADISKRIPWGGLAIFGAAVWQWLAPLLQRLMPWLF